MPTTLCGKIIFSCRAVTESEEVFVAKITSSLLYFASSLNSETFAPSNFSRKGFIYDKEDLLIPNPVTQPAEYAKAKGAKH